MKLEMRQKLLQGLLEFAEKSNTMNPHFLAEDMCKHLGLSEAEFNVARSQLGEQYCPEMHRMPDGRARYKINLAKCYALRDQLEERKKQKERHDQLVRLAVLVAILGALLGAVVTFILTRS